MAMTELARHVDDYLRMRRALGFKLVREGQVLPQLIAHVEAAGATSLTTELIIAWARLPQGVQPVTWRHRLSQARGFAAYLKTIDPATEIPPPDVFPGQGRRPTPHVWATDDISRLLAAAEQLDPPLRAASVATLLGLLAATGLRIGEALALHRDDVDLNDGLLTIRHPKFDRTRLVPLHPTTTQALQRYSVQRDQLCPEAESITFFITHRGAAIRASMINRTFNRLTTTLGLRTDTLRPRIHDLRHTFAVRTLISWHHEGIEVADRIGVLADYLGHVNPAGTYWYLTATPELMALAAQRLGLRLTS